jgi:hypothetical protein
MKKHVEMQTIKGELMQKYVVLQVTLKEKLIGTASKNLSELEDVINKQADKGYRLHTISTTSGGSKGLGCGRLKRTFSLQRRKPQIGIFYLPGFVCF